MNRPHYYAFKVITDYDNGCPTTEDEHFMALVKCLASRPSSFANLKDDEQIRFVDTNNLNPETGKPKTFLVGWQ